MGSLLYFACLILLYLDLHACGTVRPTVVRSQVETQLSTGEPVDCDQFKDYPELFDSCDDEKDENDADDEKDENDADDRRDESDADDEKDENDADDEKDENDADDEKDEKDEKDEQDEKDEKDENDADDEKDESDADDEKDENDSNEGTGETTDASTDSKIRTRRDSHNVGRCQNGWFRYKDSCYLRNRELRTWFTAKSFCAKQGAELWVADSMEEWDTVRDFATINQWTWLGLVNTAIHETTGGEKMELNGPEWVNRKTSNGGMNYRDLPWLSSASGFGHINNFNCVAYWGNPNLKLSTIHWYNCEFPPRQVICERNSTSHNTRVASTTLETDGPDRVLEKWSTTTTPNPTPSSTEGATTKVLSSTTASTTAAVTEVAPAVTEAGWTTTNDTAAEA